MDMLEAHDTLAAQAIAAGQSTPAEAAVSRAALMARLNGWAPDPEPAQAQPAQAPPANTAGTLGLTPPVPGPEESAAQPEPEELDPFTHPSPGLYDFGQPPEGVEVNAEQDLAFRDLFHKSGIPLGIGNEIGRLWHDALAHPLDEIQKEQSRHTFASTLERIWGQDYESNLALARAEVQRLAKANPAIPQMLEASNLGNNPWLATTLVTLAKERGGPR